MSSSSVILPKRSWRIPPSQRYQQALQTQDTHQPLTEEDPVKVNANEDDYTSDNANMSGVSDSVICKSTTEEAGIAMPVVSHQEKPAAQAKSGKKLAARADAAIDIDFNTAMVTVAFTKIFFLSTLFGYGASHFAPTAASLIVAKEHILAGFALLAAFFLILDISLANLVTDCCRCFPTVSGVVDAPDQEEMRKLVTCLLKLCRRCRKVLLEAVVDVADDLSGGIGVKWVKRDKPQQEDEKNEAYEAEDEQTEW